MFSMIFTVTFPFICGLLMPLLKKLTNRKVKMSVIIVLQAVITALGLLTISGGEVSTKSFVFADNLTVGFTADFIAKAFCAIITIAWLLVTIYAAVYMKHEKSEENFFLFSFLTEGAMLGTSFSNSLISMYVFYELVTLFSMPLVLHSLSKESVSAAKKYLYYSIAGAFMALFGIFVIGTNSDNLGFVAGGALSNASPLVLAAVFVMCLGFGAKAGLFPLHAWLPAAHPVAPAPASALLSGIIAKAGVLAIIRTVFFTVGADNIAGTWVQTALLVLALLTVLMGSMLAYREKVFKKRLAYSTVSQISYVFCGLFLFTEAGTVGALWQIVFHAAVKVGLFLCAGAVIFLYGKTRVDELNGIGKKMPITFVCFTILSLSLIGIPPTGGFYSKWYIAIASLEATGIGALGWIIPAILLVSALLTAGYLLEVSIKAFLKNEETEAKTVKEPKPMIAVLIVFTVIAVAGGIFAEQTQNLVTTVAASLF